MYYKHFKLIKMLSLIASAALIPVAYTLPPAKPATYSVQVSFDGYMPVLGGQEGTAQADLEFSVQGLAPDSQGNPQASTELQGLKFAFNGANLPLDIEKAKAYFPKTTLSITPQGKVLKTDAPNVSLPIRLPGLDIKRIPDLTFLPVEFPLNGIEAGGVWSFKKLFGDSEVDYELKDGDSMRSRIARRSSQGPGMPDAPKRAPAPLPDLMTSGILT